MRIGPRSHGRVIIPNLSRIKETVSLSKAAKQRLKWIDYYHAHNSNARLTCRHFGIGHRTFYRYYNRFKQQGMVGLESHSHCPNHVRQPLTPRPVVDIVRTLRKANPEFSKYKLAVILKRDYGYSLSASSVGRIISRYNLFFAPPVKQKGHPGRRQSIARIRKPKDFTAAKPGDLIEVDVKHLPHINGKRYAFVAIDVITRQATVHGGSTISSAQGALAWRKTVQMLGLPKAVLTDNGSEFHKQFHEACGKLQLTHYWNYPRSPKMNGKVERFNRTIQEEFIDWRLDSMLYDLEQFNDQLMDWLI